jgi:hypothetical protein
MPRLISPDCKWIRIFQQHNFACNWIPFEICEQNPHENHPNLLPYHVTLGIYICNIICKHLFIFRAHNAATNGAKVTNMAVDGNGDMEIHVDIPIHHGTSTSTTRTTTARKGSLYPDLPGATTTTFKQTNANNIDSEWTENITDEIQEAKMNEALAKMKELGFEGNWVRELLNTVKCDISKAVEILNPTNPTEPQLD